MLRLLNGGLELGVQAVYGGETAWVSDIDKGACKILAHRFPDVPNIGDMTSVDWAAVEPVDLICGGTPCQDLSHAGKRAGMTEGTRSNLWVAMREAIAMIRPKYVVWENVRGAASAEADSDLVNDPRLLAGVRRRDGQPLLRALGRVVGDLSDLGYVGQLRGLRAADVGAPHGRFRYFLVATDAERGGRDGWSPVAGRGAVGGAPAQGPGEGALLPTPVADNSCGLPSASTDYASLPNAVCALPTPTARDWKNVGDPGKTAGRMAERGQPLGEIVVNALLPTPSGMNASNDPGSVASWTARRDRMLELGINGNGIGTPPGIAVQMDWGQYAAAIARWESLTQPAPPPTETGPKGSPRLSAAFSEWMMGLPAGWVTDVPGITRNEALKALGNGVVPQQAAEALRIMAAWSVAA